jgi:zinc protease
VARIQKVRRLGIIFSIFTLSLPLISLKPQEESPGRSFVLPNGLNVFLYEKHDLPLVNIVVSVNAGSKDETDATNGIAHLLEHCLLFRGTGSRSGDEVSRDVRRHGAYFNANTGQDLTVFEISVPSGEADYALRNQKEVLFDFALTQADLDEEKAVVLEEMNQTDDDPQRHGMDLVMRCLFNGHPYGRPVYGHPNVVRASRVDELRDFHAKYYVPNNCALAAVGDFRSREMEERVRAIFGPLEKAGLEPASIAKAGLLSKSVTVREEKDVKEAYLFIAYIGPDCNHPDQYAMDLLTEALGRGFNPLLNIALRSRRDLVQNLNMAYIPGRFGGAVIVSLTLDPGNIAAATREALNYLRKSREENFSLDDFMGDDKYSVFDFLGSAKNQIRFSAEQAEESGLTLASSLARFMLQNERKDPGRFLDHIARTNSGDLRKAASVYFGKGQCAVVSIVPKKAAEAGRRD